MKAKTPSIPDCNLFAWRVFKILWHFLVLAGWKAMQLGPAPLKPFWMSLSQCLPRSRRYHVLNAMSQASPLVLTWQGGGRLTALPAHAGFLCLRPLWPDDLSLCFVQGGISFLALSVRSSEFTQRGCDCSSTALCFHTGLWWPWRLLSFLYC